MPTHDPPGFFVPNSLPEEAEARYVELAAWAGRSVPEASQRVYEIEWESRAQDWTARVGEHPSGERTQERRRKGGQAEVTTPLPRPGIKVLAIFPGLPHLIVTDAPPWGTARSEWVNPILATPRRIRNFTAP